jgi:hypothetical protein
MIWAYITDAMKPLEIEQHWDHKTQNTPYQNKKKQRIAKSKWMAFNCKQTYCIYVSLMKQRAQNQLYFT